MAITSHKKEVEGTACIPIYGLNPSVMEKTRITKSGANISLQDYIKRCTKAKEVEWTNMSTMEDGKFFVVLQKDRINDAKMWIKNNLNKIYKEYLGDEKEIPGYRAPKLPYRMDRDQIHTEWRDAVMKNLGYEEKATQESAEQIKQMRGKRQDHVASKGDDEFSFTANKKQRMTGDMDQQQTPCIPINNPDVMDTVITQPTSPPQPNQEEAPTQMEETPYEPPRQVVK